MKIAIAAGGRFHAFHLAEQLAQRNALTKLYTRSATKNDYKIIGAHLIDHSLPCSLLNKIIQRLRLTQFINPSKINVLRDSLFDKLLSKKIKKLGRVDLFIGLNNYVAGSLEKIKQTGSLIIIETASCHIKEQILLLNTEYKNYNLMYPPINAYNIKRMCYEYEQADYIMTISNFARDSFIKQGIPEHKLLMTPWGIEEAFFSKDYVLRKKSGKFRLIFVGLLCIRKGIHHLLEAWNKLNLPEAESELLLVGNLQKDLKQILSSIKIKANVNFFGSTTREKLRDLYRSSSTFVLPSVEDGFGMVIGEAMASGLPVICSSNTGAPDIITHGKEGFIFKAGNTEQLADYILWCYKNRDQAASMGETGANTIQNFSWNHYGKRVFKIYEDIVNNYEKNK